MQNVQNADIQRVMNLVDLYRRKVGWESQTAKDAKADPDFWEQEFANMMIEDDISMGGMNDDYPYTEVRKKLMVNEHLLGYFYAEVAGRDADKDVLSKLLPEEYDKTVFTEEEESFLKLHFKEMVNYIVLTPNDESLELVNRIDTRDAYVIPIEVLKLIGSRIFIPKGSKVFNPISGLGQFTNLYYGCKYICDSKNAWIQVAAYANGSDVEIIEDKLIPSTYNAVVSYLPGLSNDGKDIDYLFKAYESLQSGGTFILLCPPRLLVDGTNSSLRKRLVEDNAIKEIIQLPQVMSNNASFDTYCIIIAEKDREEQTTTFIDARSAQKDLDNKHYLVSFDIEAFNTIMKNNGVDPRTDRCDVIKVASNNLNERMLLPQAFLIEKPSEKDCPVPMSNICSIVTTSVRDIEKDLPMDTPWVKETDLSYFYKGELDVMKLEKADCPNNPPHTEEFAFDGDGKFSDILFYQRTTIGHRVLNYRACTYVDGKSDVVLYKRTPEDGVCTALLRATGIPVAISKNISVFCPQKGFDALSLLTLLRLPIVYRQILLYNKYGIKQFMDAIIVPTNKTVINDEIIRMDRELSLNKSQENRFLAMKTEYINEVRMRKHDMGQYVFELINIEDLMRYYLDNRDSEKDFCQQIEGLLDNFRSSLGELSTLLDNLSKEEQFGEPESINLDEFLSGLGKRHKADGFIIKYELDKQNVKRYILNKTNDESLYADDTVIDDESLYADDTVIDDESLYADDAAIDDESLYADDTVIDDESLYADDTAIDDENAYADDVAIDDESAYAGDAVNDDENAYADDAVVDDESAYAADINTHEDNCNLYAALPTSYIAPNDLQRAVNNILDNARKHGFTDSNRNDYEIDVRLSIDSEKNMFVMDFRNNGNPLPEGMNKMRYGIKGEKAGKTAGTGLGGNYVKSFVEHYGGDYDVFMEDGWTVVRIYIPIK